MFHVERRPTTGGVWWEFRPRGQRSSTGSARRTMATRAPAPGGSSTGASPSRARASAGQRRTSGSPLGSLTASTPPTARNAPPISGRHGRRRERAGDDQRETSTAAPDPGRAPRPDLPPPRSGSPAEPTIGPPQEGGPALRGVEQRRAVIGPPSRQNQAREAAAAPQIEELGRADAGLLERGGERGGVIDLLGDRARPREPSRPAAFERLSSAAPSSGPAVIGDRRRRPGRPVRPGG